MNNLVILPVILPLLIGAILVFFKNHILIQRWVASLTLVVSLSISVLLLKQVYTEGIQVIHFGGWIAPFGISFVADSFAVLLVVTANIITLVCTFYAMFSLKPTEEKAFFYTLILMLFAGVSGSFLTGDLFNLFVTFEVMLLASYGLIIIGGSRRQLRESVKYLAINILSSSLFLIAIAYLYGVMGTLNFADLSMKIADVGQTPILTGISLLLLIVFSIKSGLVLYQWMPGSYSVPSTAIAAIFAALLTKVGVYAIFRTFTLIFYHEQQITHVIIGVFAAISLIAGSIGAIAYTNIRYIAAYNIVIAIGFIMIGLSVMTSIGLEGSIYYLIHDMFVKALLFLLVGTIVYLTSHELMEDMSGLIRNYPLLGWLFFITVLALTGIPPLSGFLGKILIGQATVSSGAFVLLGLGFISSLFVLYSLMKIFMSCFWGETIISSEEQRVLPKTLIIPSVIFVVISFVVGINAELILPYIQDAAETLMQPQIYIDAVIES